MTKPKLKRWVPALPIGPRLTTTSVAFCIFSILLSSCTQKEAPISSAAKTVPQVYMLRERGLNWWNFSGKALELSLGVRVVDVEVADTKDGERILQEWSARPIDLLILGPGLPQLSFSKMTLPKVSQRKILFLGATSTHAYSVLVDTLELRKFSQSYCKDFCQERCSFNGKELAELLSLQKAQAKCQIVVAPMLEENLSLNGGFRLELDWNSIVSRILNSSAELSEKSSLAKISNAEIKVLPDPLNGKDFKNRFDLFLKNFSLENLQ